MKYQPSLVILFLTLVYSLNSCRESDTTSLKSNQSDSQITKVDTQSSRLFSDGEFIGKAGFLDSLLSHKPCVDTLQQFIPDSGSTKYNQLNSSVPYSGPYNYSQTVSAVLDFTTEYRNLSNDLIYSPTKINYSTLLENTVNRYSQDSHYGFVLHYGYSVNTKRIVYILGLGTIDSQNNDGVGHCPFPASQNPEGSTDFYILLANVGANPYAILDQTTFNNLKSAYLDNIQLITQEGPQLVKNVANHPEMVFHNPSELKSFQDEYISASNLALYMVHGSLPVTGSGPGTGIDRHTPVLVFGDDKHFFPLDNIDYPAVGLKFPYRNKAFDIGRQCPPNCPSASSICLPAPTN